MEIEYVEQAPEDVIRCQLIENAGGNVALAAASCTIILAGLVTHAGLRPMEVAKELIETCREMQGAPSTMTGDGQ